MTRLAAWYSDHLAVPLPPGHTFPMPKYHLVRRELVADGVLDPADLHPSRPAPLDWLTLVHDPAYVRAVLAGELDAAARRRIGLPWSEALVLRARAAVYGTVMAARAALAGGLAGNLAGGTHHAFRDRGEGYCLFNDLAVAVAVLRAETPLRRFLVLDLDVHQGNGTAALFAHDPEVFTLSLHAARNYPLHKERSTLDVPLPDGCDDATFLAALDRVLEPALEAHRPELVLYQAGVDGLSEDRLGHLALTHAGLMERDRRVFAACRARGLPVAVTLGGGYGRPLEATVRAHANVWRVMAATPSAAGSPGRTGDSAPRGAARPPAR